MEKRRELNWVNNDLKKKSAFDQDEDTLLPRQCRVKWDYEMLPLLPYPPEFAPSDYFIFQFPYEYISHTNEDKSLNGHLTPADQIFFLLY